MTNLGSERANGFFFALCTVGLFAILSSTMSKNPVLPLFAESLGTPEYLLGLVAAASTIPGIIVSLPAGTLSDIFGRRKVILLSAFVFASAPFLYVLVVLPWQLALVRFYHGFATAIFGPVASAAIVERFPKSKAERVSSFSSVTMVGRGIAPFLGGYILLMSSSNYHELYVAVGVAGVVAFLTALALREHKFTGVKSLKATRPRSSNRISQVFQGWRKVAENRWVIVTSLVEAAQYYTFGAFEFFVVVYAQSLGFDTLLIVIVAGVQWVTVIFAKPFMGRLSDRYGRRTPIVIGLLVASVPLVATPFASQFPQLVVISVFYGLGFSLVTSSTAALVSDVISEELYGAAMGFLSTIMDVGQTLGPIVTGLILATGAGFLGSFTALGGILLFFCIFFYVFTRAKITHH